MLPNRDLLQSRGDTNESIREAFGAHLVVPDVIDRAPSFKLPLLYKSGAQIALGSLQCAENVCINDLRGQKTTIYMAKWLGSSPNALKVHGSDPPWSLKFLHIS
jgi:hypothetical protein